LARILCIDTLIFREAKRLFLLPRITRIKVVLSLITIVLASGCTPPAEKPAETTKSEFPLIRGPYLGQEPPGMEPEIFAPGLASTGENEAIAFFFPNERSVYFSGKWASPQRTLLFTHEIDGLWTPPRLISLSGRTDFASFVTAFDGELYFNAAWPLQGEEGTEDKDWNIWRVEPTQTGFDEPQPLPPTVNTEANEICPSIATDGTLYYCAENQNGFGQVDILFSRREDGEYIELENPGASINTEFNEWDPFIAPDQSYVLFISDRPESYGDNDLYISFKREDGAWAEAVNLGDKINSTQKEVYPMVTRDGSYLFFGSNRPANNPELESIDPPLRPGTGSMDIYWVDARVLEQFRPE
jgi:hypothetical protein